MKLAIMTLPLGKNYGGIMQAFALQKVLVKLGHEAVTIDRHANRPSLARTYLRLIYRATLKLTGKRKAPINFERYYPLIFQHPQRFVSEHIDLSEHINTQEGLNKNFSRNHYDGVIVGSDQTWRPGYSGNIYNYFLDFLEGQGIRKVTYAASFGVERWEFTDEETQRCAILAKEFDAISVRETSGVDLCEEYLNVKAVFVLDPTFLLKKEDYLGLIGERYKKKAGDGVYTYWLDGNEEKYSAAGKIAKKLNTHIYQCQAKDGLNNLKSGVLDDYTMPPVEDWLASFANAKVVLTDSFHGMVFSIIFEKPFIVVINKDRGAARFESLLCKLGMEDRMVEEPTVISQWQTEKILSNKLINNDLDEFKRESMDFLTRALRG